MSDKHSDEDSSFRDRVSTVDDKGKRKWMYVWQVKGKLYKLRTYLSYFYLVVFFALPFIKVNGSPLFLLNVVERKFIIFGKVFLPTDFVMFGIAMLIGILFIIVFTLAYGRIFCGWVCPQTVFMEMVFRKIEYLLEGSAAKQQKQNNGTWTTEMYIRKGIKHLIFFIIAFLVANTFLAYIIGKDALFQIITEPVTQHLGGFFSIIGFSFIFYAVFAYVRELVCTVVCPYGRLQSVLLDKNSVVVAYDKLRGEPRTKGARKRNETDGDCVDCDMCVKVCPTGIDIRNGTQLECVNCTACIDACNEMMLKVNREPQLIKYASENNIEKNEKFHFTYRLKAYSAVLAVLLIIFSYLLIAQKMFDVTVLRVPGQILQENPDGTISNLYKVILINKKQQNAPVHLEVEGLNASIEYVGNRIDSLNSGQDTEQTFFIKVPQNDIKTRSNKLKLKVMSGEKLVDTKKVIFIGEY